MEPTHEKSYTSPPRKLVKFFAHSRDRWKAKSRAAKTVLKRLGTRLGRVERRNAAYQEQVAALQTQVTEWQAKHAETVRELEELKKKASGDSCRWLTRDKSGGEVVRHHQYGVQQVLVVVSLVLATATSLRGAGRALAVRQACAGVGPWSPSWSSTRLWLLRLGYYKVTRPKEEGRDWVWIVAQVVQTGQEKCLLIVGIRLRALPAEGEYLTHADVEPIVISPVPQSNGEIVYQQLEEARKRTGVPREILSDQGSDLPKGIRQFCQAHPETSFIYDIKHKVAAVLKRELGASPTWQEFSRLAGQTSQRVQQTALAALAPPRQRRKARDMNVAALVSWGVRMVQYLDEDGSPRQAWDRHRVEEAVGWVRQYRHEVDHWRQWVEVGTITEQFIKAHGVAAGGAQQLQSRLAAAGTLPRTQQLGAEFVQFVTEEEAKAKAGERLVGSSEVIESIFGKWKRLEGEQARSGLTGLVLALGALVAPTTAAVITPTLTTVPTKTVLTWCHEKLGKTVQATRRALFASLRQAEQKPDQVPLAA